jgi:hypothetical protein
MVNVEAAETLRGMVLEATQMDLTGKIYIKYI